MSGSEVDEVLLAAVAQGHRDALAQLYARNAPWLQVRLATRHPGARLAWRTAEGTVRQIGDPPPGSALVPPTLEDGYLLLIGAESATVDGSEGQVAA